MNKDNILRMSAKRFIILLRNIDWCNLFFILVIQWMQCFSKLPAYMTMSDVFIILLYIIVTKHNPFAPINYFCLDSGIFLSGKLGSGTGWGFMVLHSTSPEPDFRPNSLNIVVLFKAEVHKVDSIDPVVD